MDQLPYSTPQEHITELQQQISKLLKRIDELNTKLSEQTQDQDRRRLLEDDFPTTSFLSPSRRRSSVLDADVSSPPIKIDKTTPFSSFEESFPEDDSHNIVSSLEETIKEKDQQIKALHDCILEQTDELRRLKHLIEQSD
ncbi:hypothetical protein GEMRC1_007197 [Eukaryota sp. GEM-RC1]